MQQVATRKRSLKPEVYFRHVPRHLNALADWLTNVSRHLEADMSCTHLCKYIGPFADPPCDPKVAGTETREMVAAIGSKRARRELSSESEQEPT
jgi:hypothetical protein